MESRINEGSEHVSTLREWQVQRPCIDSVLVLLCENQEGVGRVKAEFSNSFDCYTQ